MMFLRCLFITVTISSLCCKSHYFKTADINILSWNSKHRR